MFEIQKSDDGQYYFTLKAPNGEVIAVSELYTQKHNCIRGIQSVMINASEGKIVDKT